MKFKKLLLPFLAFIFFSIASCSSDSENLQKIITDPATENLSSIEYPYAGANVLSNSFHTKKYEYDNMKRINKFNIGGDIYDVTYVSSDMIEINLIDDLMTGVKAYSKRRLKLKNGNVTNIVDKRFFIRESTSEVFGSQIDSTAFTYSDSYLSKIDNYLSDDNGKTFKLQDKFDFQVTGGNITQVKKTDSFTKNVFIWNYKYDTNSHINFGDMMLETPFFLAERGRIGIFLNDMLGKKSTNNITSIEYDYSGVLSYYNDYSYYKNITLKRNLDKFGRLNEILMSGSVFMNLKDGTTITKTFSDAKLKLTYK